MTLREAERQLVWSWTGFAIGAIVPVGICELLGWPVVFYGLAAMVPVGLVGYFIGYRLSEPTPRWASRIDIHVALPAAVALAILIGLGVCADAAAAPRSRTLLAEFKRLNPCPSTSKTRGACPGFQIDHIQPLCAGGQDELANLHWLSIADHAAKTRKDVAACFGRAYRAKG